MPARGLLENKKDMDADPAQDAEHQEACSELNAY